MEDLVLIREILLPNQAFHYGLQFSSPTHRNWSFDNICCLQQHVHKATSRVSMGFEEHATLLSASD